MYNLTAQLQLQAPPNSQSRRVVNSINRQLQGVAVDVRLNVNNRQIQQAVGNINQISTSAKKADKDMNSLGKTFGTATRRFGSVALVTGFFLGLTRGIRDALREAIQFESELVKISQVTGKTKTQLSGLTNEVTKLSTRLGVASGDILNTSRVLAQAGFSASETTRALKILSQTTLAATFDNIQDTTEGAIAILNQFKDAAQASGDEIGFLEKSLDAINQVSKKFAVESGDLISVIRRSGGVFEAAGGSLNELIALFTSVRSTTRQSAETIAVGLRTVFTRIQRSETIESLRSLGIELQDVDGKFVGPLEAVKRLSQGLKSLDPRDVRFNQIVEDLGGFRQIGNVIPLITKFRISQEALNVAQKASGSIAEDAETAQQSLAVQITKVREEFRALFRRITDSEGFKEIVSISLQLAKALIKVGDALTPLIPLLTVFAGVKLGSSLTGFGKGLLGRNKGGSIPKFASGGFVPGAGNRDTVPAMLTPGEFVIKKSSAESLGAQTLSAMNENKFATGGLVALRPYDEDTNDSKTVSGKVTSGSVANKLSITKGRLDSILKSGKISDPLVNELKGSGANLNVVGTTLGDSELSNEVEGKIRKSFLIGIKSATKRLASKFGSSGGNNITDKDLDTFGVKSVIGNAFEASLAGLGTPFDKGKNQDAFDFKSGLGSLAGQLGVPSLTSAPTDAKRTLSSKEFKSVIDKKYPNFLAGKIQSFLASNPTAGLDTKQNSNITGILAKGKLNDFDREELKKLGVISKKSVSDSEIDELRKRFGVQTKNLGGLIQKFAKGGSPEDTVPALLTPGEFVINKSSAQSIGMNNLESMNKTGVAQFNKGGSVGRFQKGGSVGVSTSQFPDISSKVLGLAKQLSNAKVSVESINKVLPIFSQSLQDGTSDFDALSKAVQAAGGDLKDLESGVTASKKAQDEQKEAINANNTAMAESTNKAFATAQGLVFFAGSLGAVITQMGSFSEETKVGITTAVTQFTVLVGILGTVGQALTGFALKLSTSANSNVAAFGSELLGVLGPVALVATAGLALVSVFNGMEAAAQAAIAKLQEVASNNVSDIVKNNNVLPPENANSIRGTILDSFTGQDLLDQYREALTFPKNQAPD